MVLNNGKLNYERLAAGDASGKALTHLVVGTSNTPEQPTDTAITAPLQKAITSVQYMPGNIVKLIAQIDAADPAMNIWEIGVLNADGVLCHRKVYGSVKSKVAGLAYTITYSIKVS